MQKSTHAFFTPYNFFLTSSLGSTILDLEKPLAFCFHGESNSDGLQKIMGFYFVSNLYFI